MHIHNIHTWKHTHQFHAVDTKGERNTRRVIALTLTMMVIEIAAGYLSGSMALLADGWHMGTHAVALGITAFAYYYARRHAENPNYSFGTGKVGTLGGFASAAVLAVIALLMGVESISRLINPHPIRFNEAILVAVIGLSVNIVSALLLQDKHHHEHDHTDRKHHHDHNLRAAYLHVIADALTSLLAIVALVAGKALGWVWMDPIMGIVGAIIITKWAHGLLLDTGKILLDRDVDQDAIAEIRNVIETDSDNRVSDIHVWRVGPRHLSVIISLVTHYPKPPEHYKKLLAAYDDISHLTVEVNACEGESCVKPDK
jgi:cation diffusion facilitator family transporter